MSDVRKAWFGSLAIPLMPFDEKDRIEEDVYAAEIEFCIGAGARGIPVPMMVSEYDMLSEAERRMVVQTAVEVAKRRVPVIANCTAPNRATAMAYAGFAAEHGAAAVIALAKSGVHPDFESLFDYYAGIAHAAGGLPVIIQDHDFASIPVDWLIRLCTEIPNVNWIKEEVMPTERRITEILARRCPHIHGVMGGYGGIRLITEWERGARAWIHACDLCDVLQHLCELLDAGRMAEAGDVFEKMLVVLTMEGMGGLEAAKEILVRRGVFRNHACRWRKKEFDAHFRWEFDRAFARIEPYLRWPAIKRGAAK
jgi:4-hydroxy-tetrahydrodipicolinate synthase